MVSCCQRLRKRWPLVFLAFGLWCFFMFWLREFSLFCLTNLEFCKLESEYSESLTDKAIYHVRSTRLTDFILTFIGFLSLLLIGSPDGAGRTEDKRRRKVNTGYSFQDRFHNFLDKFTRIVMSVHKLNKLGRFW